MGGGESDGGVWNGNNADNSSVINNSSSGGNVHNVSDSFSPTPNSSGNMYF